MSSSGSSSPFSICSLAISPKSVSAWISDRSRFPCAWMGMGRVCLCV